MTGGVKNNDASHDVCERYNMETNQWQLIQKLPYPAFSMTLIVMDKRYIYMFGGITYSH